MTSNVRTPINSVTQTPIAAHNVPDEYHCSALITMAGIQADTGKATRGEGRRGRHGAQRPDQWTATDTTSSPNAGAPLLTA